VRTLCTLCSLVWPSKLIHIRIFLPLGTPSLSSPRSSPSPRIPEPSRTPSPGPPVRSPTTSPFRHQHDSVNIKSAPIRKVSVDSAASETELAYFSTRSPPAALVDPNKTLPLLSDSTYSKDSIAFPSQGSYSNRRSQVSSVASSYTSPMPNEDRSSASGESDVLETRRDSLASVSQYSTTTMKVGLSLRASKSTGAMGSIQPPRQHLETLVEENGGSVSPPIVEGLKLPVRSKTTPGPTGPTTRRKRSIKACLRCGKVIDDGRWIAIDNGKGGVLCEKDWKEMYLPKCRRCGLTIESQAVSSADGQLKGKYHRECFSCSTCQVCSLSLSSH
jgi:PDZ and LIM domain protein 5/6/7